MIALRGTLRKDENDSSWRWTGVWAFGTLPKQVAADTSSTPGRKPKQPATRPFVYAWKAPRDASSVIVPSANLPSEKEEPTASAATDTKQATDTTEDDSAGEVLTKDTNEAEKMKAAEDTQQPVDMKTSPPGPERESKTKTNAPIGDGTSSQPPSQEDTPDSKKEETTLDTMAVTKEKAQASTEGKTGAKDESAIVSEHDAKEKTAARPKDTVVKKGEGGKAENEKEDAKGEPVPGIENEANESKEKDVKEQVGGAGTKEGLASEPLATLQEESKVAEASTTPVAKETRETAVTYATTSPGDPPYTDASTLHAEKCPPSGSWTGYFENVPKRKDRLASRVSENFCLFFNATPPKDARVLFLDDDEGEPKKMQEAKDSEEEIKSGGGNDDTPRGMLPPGLIHVRGMGTNQFGTFELLGCLDLATGVLECQRMYIITVDSFPSSRRSSTATPSSGKRVAKPRSDEASASGSSITPRAYNTRKRQMSWQRRSTMSDDEEEEVSRRRTSSTKKRPRSSPADGKPVTLSASFSSAATPGGFKTTGTPASGSSKRPSPTQRSLSSVGSQSGTAGPGTVARKKPSPTNKGGTASSLSLAVQTKLPVAGDPRQARWRAAHFLYYQRNDPTADELGGGSANSPSNDASYVVYEGEMLQGECLRDGRGVCLYSNGTLYEGEWKRNKEHGKGTLMSADRKKVIYKGEWERGRMHGVGTYYYSHNDSLFMRRKEDADGVTSRYEGDFKENARHGMGKYYLMDGSVYEGEWREDQPSGRGTFRWVDGSVYVGLWKDGKRNGQGTLQTSDGFTYDGMWVRNAMEGRGIATYPNGQRYEGLWVGGRREGRGTIRFTNGATYEGRFRDDCMEGQGTMKMSQTVTVPRSLTGKEGDNDDDAEKAKDDWMMPISFQSDMGRIHQKAGFTIGGD